MKKWTSFRYRNLYLFFMILIAIGFFAGYKYYSLETDESKSMIVENVNIEDELNHGVNNVFKRVKSSVVILVFSLIVIGIPINIVRLFYDSFAFGFLFNVLKTYSFKFSFIFISIYHIVPFIFQLIMCRVGITIGKNVILYFINNRDRKVLKMIKLLVKKYFIILGMLVIYEMFVWLFNGTIHSYLINLI